MSKPTRWCFCYHKMTSATSHSLADLCLTAAFLALVILCRFISQYFNFINGYSLQIQYVPLLLGLIWIRNARYRFLLFLISPIIELAFGFSGNPIFDYLFTGWSWWIFLLLTNRFQPVKTVGNYFWMSLGISFSVLQMYWWNVLSGVVFYQVSWSYSAIFNGVFNLINYFVIMFIGLYFVHLLFIFKINNNPATKLKPIFNFYFFSHHHKYFKKEILTFQSCKTKLNREKPL